MAEQYYYETVLLMPMDGSNGSTSFPDASVRNAQLTAPSGGVSISTAQSKFGGASALFVKSSSGYLASTAWSLDMGQSDYTIRFWVRFVSITGIQGMVMLALGNSSAPVLRKNASHQIEFNGTSFGATTVAAGQFYHLEITRASGTVRAFLDGVQIGSIADSTSLNSITGFWIGRDSSGNTLDGYIDDLQIIRGVALHTANFTPPTSALDTGSLSISYAMLAPIDIVHATVQSLTYKSLRPDTKVYSAYFGGLGRISGTTKIKGTPNYAVRRKVRCHRDVDGLLVGETWSDPITGAYTFDNIGTQYKYTVITYDYEHNYRAVIADNLTPDPMP